MYLSVYHWYFTALLLFRYLAEAQDACSASVHIDKRSRGEGASSISGLVVEYIVAIDVTRVRFPADAFLSSYIVSWCTRKHGQSTLDYDTAYPILTEHE